MVSMVGLVLGAREVLVASLEGPWSYAWTTGPATAPRAMMADTIATSHRRRWRARVAR